MPRPLMAREHLMEGGQADMYAFNFYAAIRAAFLSQVFTLVTMMLIVVCAMVAAPFSHEVICANVRTDTAHILWSCGCFGVVYMILACCKSVRRLFPFNILMAALLTITVGYMTMMCICGGQFELTHVFLCMIFTAACCGSIITFASQTKYDLTNTMDSILIATPVLIIFGSAAMVAFSSKVRLLHGRAICCTRTLVGSIREVEPDADQISAAIPVFVDIVLLFWMFLSFSLTTIMMSIMFIAFFGIVTMIASITFKVRMGGRKFEIGPEHHIFTAVHDFMEIAYIIFLVIALLRSINNNGI